MPLPKKEGRLDIFHIGNWARTKLREEAEHLNMSASDVATDILKDFYDAVRNMDGIDLDTIEPSSYLHLRLSPESRKVLDDICRVTGVRPSSALNVILLWSYA